MGANADPVSAIKARAFEQKGFLPVLEPAETAESLVLPSQVSKISSLFPRRLSPVSPHSVIPSGPSTQHGCYLPCLPVMIAHPQYMQGEPSLRETRDDRPVTMSLWGRRQIFKQCTNKSIF